MDLTSAIQAFNESSDRKIKMVTSRDGRVTATLPRTGHKIIAQGSPFNTDVQVKARDVALLCEEARLSAAPGTTLLDAALTELGEDGK